MTDYGYTPVIRLPKSKVDRYPDQVNNHSIVSETLFLKSFPSTIGENDLRLLLKQYQPLEIQLHRHSGEGYIRFRDASVADQVYALYQSSQFGNGTKLHFSVYQDSHYEPEGMLLKVANLPRYVENTMVYDLFRRYGPLALCKLLLEQDDSGYNGTALIQYFSRDDSESAIQTMHGQMVAGNKIVVESFISNDLYQKSSPSSTSMNPDKSSDPNYVDDTNLYVKNLDPKVTNNELFSAFRPFGRIVSARVMTNPANNQSKGYGFVSYGRSDEARAALEQMNGKLFYQKPLMVSFHAPKKPRQTTTSAAATQASPPQEYSSSYQQQQQQQQHQQVHHRHDIATPNSTTSTSLVNGLGIDNVDQLSMDIKDFSMGQQNASIPTYPIQRKLSATDNYMSMPQVRMSSPFSSSPISGSTGHSLASLASGLSIQQAPLPPTSSSSVAHHQQQQTQHTPPAPTLATVAGSLSHTSPQSLSGSSHHHHYPANGRLTKDYKQTAEGRPSLRRKSSLESISTVMTESSANLQRQKLTQAVLQCDVPFDNPSLVSEIVDMLLTLKKRERSLCLFNQDFLKAKIELALEALETFHDGDDSEEDEEDEEDKVLQKMLPRQPSKKKSLPLRSSPTPVAATAIAAAISPTPEFTMMSQQQQQPSSSSSYHPHSHHNDIPKTIPARVSRAIPIVAPPSPAATATEKTPKPTTKATSGLSKADEAVVDTLMKSMEGKAIHEKKQLLGDRLFPLVKATGTKQAPKVTIALLDSVDLLELATMMFDKDTLKKQAEIAFTALKQQQKWKILSDEYKMNNGIGVGSGKMHFPGSTLKKTGIDLISWSGRLKRRP
ncbi:hypothetical protein BCR42DRAFT_492888 [Absidia repens]|uniref:Uncharacterized protein n=1 Tax=Absidia repens TaxID=90262 RepID=A0A1X2IBN3_9FUNG|nr:hypothetical protein BCR42DRAFT_492888 [Absidia repens]